KRDLKIAPNIELTPHTLRRCFATYQAINVMPLPTLQRVLGHASQTVNIFIPNEENSDHQLLETKNQTLQDKNKLLTQELASRDKTITDLQNNLKKVVNDKELAEQQLISEQTKNQQLELLLKAEQAKNQALIKQNNKKFSTDNQLIAQIEIPIKK
ncbi:7525_t:CDS:2, partial [Diversispora eburnea]